MVHSLNKHKNYYFIEMLFQRKGERISGCVKVSLHNFHSLAELFFRVEKQKHFTDTYQGAFQRTFQRASVQFGPMKQQ